METAASETKLLLLKRPLRALKKLPKLRFCKKVKVISSRESEREQQQLGETELLQKSFFEPPKKIQKVLAPLLLSIVSLLSNFFLFLLPAPQLLADEAKA